jgi:hypothetical protein
MATRTGTVTNVVKLRGPDPMTTGEADVSVYAVFVDNLSGSSVIGGTDTLRVTSLVTSVNSFVRDGKTRTVVGGAVSPWQRGVGSAGVAVGFTTSLSTAQLDISPVSISDWSTNATLPAGSMQQPFAVAVAMREV